MKYAEVFRDEGSHPSSPLMCPLPGCFFPTSSHSAPTASHPGHSMSMWSNLWGHFRPPSVVPLSDCQISALFLCGFLLFSSFLAPLSLTTFLSFLITGAICVEQCFFTYVCLPFSLEPYVFSFPFLVSRLLVRSFLALLIRRRQKIISARIGAFFSRIAPLGFPPPRLLLEEIWLPSLLSFLLVFPPLFFFYLPPHALKLTLMSPFHPEKTAFLPRYRPTLL